MERWLPNSKSQRVLWSCFLFQVIAFAFVAKALFGFHPVYHAIVTDATIIQSDRICSDSQGILTTPCFYVSLELNTTNSETCFVHIDNLWSTPDEATIQQETEFPIGTSVDSYLQEKGTMWCYTQQQVGILGGIGIGFESIVLVLLLVGILPFPSCFLFPTSTVSAKETELPAATTSTSNIVASDKDFLAFEHL
jgi:hypothetical protein